MNVQCRLCGQYGHIIRTCPRISRGHPPASYPAATPYGQSSISGRTDANGEYSKLPPPMRGTAGRLSIPTSHYMMQYAISLDGQEELVKVEGNLNRIPVTALVDSGSQRSYVSVQLLNKAGIPPRKNASSVKITYENKETTNSLGVVTLVLHLEKVTYKPQTYDILEVMPFSVNWACSDED